jgi:transporter family-2 protein
VLYIATAAVVVRWIGVLLLGLAAISGQLIGAVAIDLAVPTEMGFSLTALAGSAMTLVGVAVAAGVSRRHAGR